jgi:hypothetical protein
MAGGACDHYKPDHNTECLHCDEIYDAHIARAAIDEIGMLAAQDRSAIDAFVAGVRAADAGVTDAAALWALIDAHLGRSR